MELVKVSIDRVIGSSQNEFAVVVRAEIKSFLIFVGQPEAIAIFRELKSVEVQRPLPHDVITNLLTAFDIEVRKIAISSIVNNVFCATLLLTQEVEGAVPNDARRNEVRLDLRASDAMIIALKKKVQLWASREVIDSVEDVTGLLKESDEMGDEDTPMGEEEGD